MSICVIGSVNQDYVLRVRAIPGPGETVLSDGLGKHPGGKGANQAVAAARLGAAVRFVGGVGDDEDGAALLAHLRAEGIETQDVEVVAGTPTGIAMVTLDAAGENSIVVAPGANFALTAQRAAAAIAAARPGLVALQAEVPRDIVVAAVAAADAAGARVVLNLSPYLPLAAEVLAVCDPLVLNETEVAALVARPVDGVGAARAAAVELTGRARSVVVTLGGRGAVWADRSSSGAVPAPAVAEVVDTTGAGDAFAGALCARLAAGAGLRAAVEAGVLVGSIAVTREGAQSSYPVWADVERALAAGPGGVA